MLLLNLLLHVVVSFSIFTIVTAKVIANAIHLSKVFVSISLLNTELNTDRITQLQMFRIQLER